MSDQISEKTLFYLYDKMEELFKDDKERRTHVIGVADMSLALAAVHKESQKRAYVAGLLHDCAKNVPPDIQIKECEEAGLEITQAERQAPYLLHAKLGAYYAEHKYGIFDEGILDAIRTHTVGSPAMTALQKIVFIADYIEPLRPASDRLEALRVTAFKDLDRAVYEISSYTIEKLKKAGRVIDETTYNTCRYYKGLFE